jgi:Flp pilus assembly protein TadG
MNHARAKGRIGDEDPVIRPHRPDRGSASAELVLLTPLLVAVLGCAFFAGRLVLARQAVDEAAGTALQAAVIMPDASEARETAVSTALAALAPGHGLCTHESTATDTARFAAGGTVFVTVTCVVPFSSLAFTGLPGTVQLSATQGADIEPYREIGR